MRFILGRRKALWGWAGLFEARLGAFLTVTLYRNDGRTRTSQQYECQNFRIKRSVSQQNSRKCSEFRVYLCRDRHNAVAHTKLQSVLANLIRLQFSLVLGILLLDDYKVLLTLIRLLLLRRWLLAIIDVLRLVGRRIG